MSRELLWSIKEYEADAEFAMHDLVETLKQYFPGDVLCISTNKADWTGRPGVKVVDMSDRDNEDIYHDIVPSHECLFNLYKDGEEIYAIVSSHDIPTGAKWEFTGRRSCS